MTANGVRTNVRVALEYLAAWLAGSGAVGIDNLMEDTATAEISRAQLWQWIHHRVPVDGAEPLTASSYRRLREEISSTLERTRTDGLPWRDAAALLDEIVLPEQFVEFLTIPGGKYLEKH